MKWSNGSPLELAVAIEATDRRLREGVHQILRETVAEANTQQRLIITKAETETGRRRAADEGRSPGRIDTGQMINTTNARAIKADNGVFIGTWGWRDPEAYYLMQDYGTKRIAPALSLLTSFLVARTNLNRKIRALVRTGGKL